jgi:hypothetical protein
MAALDETEHPSRQPAGAGARRLVFVLLASEVRFVPFFRNAARAAIPVRPLAVLSRVLKAGADVRDCR